MKAHLFIVGLLLLTTACGFHLRGSQTTQIDVSNIYILSENAPRLAREVQSQLSGAGATLASSPESASYIVRLAKESFDKSVRSVSATTGKVEEYQLVFKAYLSATHADGKNIISNDRIQTIRDFTFDEDAVLGKFSEEELIREDMISRAANQVLRRLQALLSSS